MSEKIRPVHPNDVLINPNDSPIKTIHDQQKSFKTAATAAAKPPERIALTAEERGKIEYYISGHFKRIEENVRSAIDSANRVKTNKELRILEICTGIIQSGGSISTYAKRAAEIYHLLTEEQQKTCIILCQEILQIAEKLAKVDLRISNSDGHLDVIITGLNLGLDRVKQLKELFIPLIRN